MHIKWLPCVSNKKKMQNTSTPKGHLKKFKRQMLAFSKNIKTRQKIEREITLQHKLPTLKIFLIKTNLDKSCLGRDRDLRHILVSPSFGFCLQLRSESECVFVLVAKAKSVESKYFWYPTIWDSAILKIPTLKKLHKYTSVHIRYSPNVINRTWFDIYTKMSRFCL